jgi:cell division protein FtsN
MANKTTQLVRAQPSLAKTLTKPVAQQTAPRREGNFVVQVASFKARQDAEHMKGLLILKGFEVTVAPISTPTQGNWFRVIIGPYPNRVLALKAQGILAKTQRLRGMVRST